MNKPSTETRRVAETIAQYFLEKNNKDYPKAKEEIERVKFTDIDALAGKTYVVVVTTSRPGVLIDPYGKNIDSLVKFLEKELGQTVLLKIKEEEWNATDLLTGILDSNRDPEDVGQELYDKLEEEDYKMQSGSMDDDWDEGEDLNGLDDINLWKN